MKGRQSGRSRKKNRPQRKSQRPANAKRCSWICPTCRHKNTQRSKVCDNCGFKRDGLNRPPSRRDILQAQSIQYDKEGQVLRDEMAGQYQVECLAPTSEGDAEWELNSAFETPGIAIQYARILASMDSTPTVRVMDTEEDEEVWNSTTGAEVIE